MSNTAFSSTCLHCSLGCGIRMEKSLDGKDILSGDAAHPLTKGHLCSIGERMPERIAKAKNRLVYPQMRMNRQLPPSKVSLEETLERMAAVIKALTTKYGRKALGIHFSGQCLKEEKQAFAQFLDCLGSANSEAKELVIANSTMVSHHMAFSKTTPFAEPDIETADCILLSSSDLSLHDSVLWKRIKTAKEQNPETKLVYIGSQQNTISEIADIHLQIQPGTESILNAAMARLILEMEEIDPSLIAHDVEEFEKYKAYICQRSIKDAAKIGGVKVADIQWVAEYIHRAEKLATIVAKSIGLGAYNVERNLSFIYLHALMGHFRKEGSGLLFLDDLQTSLERCDNTALKKLFASFDHWADHFQLEKEWEHLNYSFPPLDHSIHALTENPKIIWLVQPSDSISKQEEAAIIQKLKEARFVILQDSHNQSPFLPYADVVLPMPAWYEKQGTWESPRGHASAVLPLVEKKEEVKDLREIVSSLAKRMGFDGVAEATTLEPETSPKALFSSKVRFQAPKEFLFDVLEYNVSGLSLALDYDVYVTQGKWKQLEEHSYAFMHPQDAEKSGCKEGDIVSISKEGAISVKAKLRISSKIKKGLLLLPLHVGEAFISQHEATQHLVSLLTCQPSKHLFPSCALKVEKFTKPKQKILIIGAGSGTLAFIKKYREHNLEDEIVVFSKEELPFYNRVLLPEYIAGSAWDKLVTLPETEEERYQFTMHKGVSVEYINRENKYVLDSKGVEHGYDILVLGMGSKAFIPPNVPKDLKGIYTIRSRYDVDSLMNRIRPNSKVLIVGAGLISLEVAGAFEEIGILPTLIVRGSRLMDRQLDATASHLLTEELKDRNIEVYFNDEIQHFIGNDEIRAVQLKSGHVMECDVLIYGVGTVPNTELVKQCGLDHKRGVLVNDVMQTSDPSILAIGEIIEWRNQLFGIVAAAEQHAQVAASYLNGDPTAFYEGTLGANILKIPGINVCSVGINEMPEEEGYQEILFVDKRLHFYKKVIIHHDKLVGAILIGDKSEFMEFKQWMADDIELGEKRDKILRGDGEAKEPVLGKLVCSCNGVGEGNLVNKIKAGCTELAQLCKTTGAGTGCGSCRPEVKAIIEKTLVNS